MNFLGLMNWKLSYMLKETLKVDISHQKITSTINKYLYIVQGKKSTSKISHRLKGSRNSAFIPRHHVTENIFHARLQKTIILDWLQVLALLFLKSIIHFFRWRFREQGIEQPAQNSNITSRVSFSFKKIILSLSKKLLFLLFKNTS